MEEIIVTIKKDVAKNNKYIIEVKAFNISPESTHYLSKLIESMGITFGLKNN